MDRIATMEGSRLMRERLSKKLCHELPYVVISLALWFRKASNVEEVLRIQQKLQWVCEVSRWLPKE